MATRKTISLEGLDQFEVDEYNQLYWRGQQVVTTMRLPFLVNVALLLTSVATGVSAVAAVITLLR